jgi:hypothetical protein
LRHTVSRWRMRWQNFSNIRIFWERYLPDPGGSEWRVCRQCSEVIAAHDAQEMARDRRQMLTFRIVGGTFLVVVFIAAFLGSLHPLPHVPPLPLP